jgi:pimeloyl-ACP methyl ester carboxylesterase
MRFAGRVAGAITMAAVASAIYQRMADAHDRRRFPPPGEMVQTGDGRRHLLVLGSGSPTVVIVPALASTVMEWVPVQRAISAHTRVAVYERAGTGWSDPPRRWVTMDTMTAELRAVLDGAGIEPPYVLAGHSIGGIIARRFQARYPETVAGMLLIDSSHGDQVRRLDDVHWRQGTWRILKAILGYQAKILGARRAAAALGLTRRLDAEVVSGYPAEYAAQARAHLLSTNVRRTAVRELLVLLRGQEQAGSLGSLPLTVLSRGPQDWRGWPAWQRMQAELAALSRDSQHSVAVRAGHCMHLDAPELVIQAIGELVGRCR